MVATPERLTRLYLVRHAIAEDRDGVRWPDDSRRPLTDRGQERFASAARGLNRLVPTVELVLSSEFVRAWRTAEILREQAGWPAPERCAWLAANRAPDAALDPLADRWQARSIALVGHEPYLSSLASLLLTGSEGRARLELKKGGVIALAFRGRPVPGAAILHWSAAPGLLRRLESALVTHQIRR